jgi:nucleoside-diphosphate-sugar epimerase
MAEKNVLIAGASGFVGGAAIECFAANGWRVIGLSRRAGKDSPEGRVPLRQVHQALPPR